MAWDNDLGILAAGLVNGKIICYGVWAEKGFKSYDEVKNSLNIDFLVLTNCRT